MTNRGLTGRMAATPRHLRTPRVARSRYCPGGYTEPQRVQRNVRLIHAARTDVFELQLPRGSQRAAGLALAAALRDALAERLGADTREIGLAVGGSVDVTKDPRVSIFLHDRAAGGAGLVARLTEAEWFRLCLANATERLGCSEDCAHGCPACILRPDLNFGEERLDRPAGLALAKALQERLNLPAAMQLFGPETRVLGLPLPDWLDRQLRVGRLPSTSLKPLETNAAATTRAPWYLLLCCGQHFWHPILPREST